MRRLLPLLILVLAACGSDSTTTPTSASVVGAYTLKTVNGANTPAVIAQTAAGKFEVLDDVVTLNADHTYSEAGHLRTTLANGTVTTSPQVDQGTYTSTNGAVQFTSTVGNGVTNGSINGNTLTIIDTGITLVYSK